MSTVRVKPNGQVTLPAELRKQVGLRAGDLLEARVEKGKITLTPKSVVDLGLAESLKDYKEGRFYGPFDSADEMIGSLERPVKKTARKLRSGK